MKKSPVYLVPFTRKHLRKTFCWIKDETLRERFKFSKDVTWEAHLNWFKGLATDNRVELFAVHSGGSGQYVGNCGLKHIDMNKRYCEMWIYLGENDCYGKGYGTAAVALLLQYVFDELKMEAVGLYVTGDNHAARRIYEKNGFSEKPLPVRSVWCQRDVPDTRYMERRNGADFE